MERNAKYALFVALDSVARGKQQEKHLPASRVCQNKPPYLQPDRQLALSLLSARDSAIVTASCVTCVCVYFTLAPW